MGAKARLLLSPRITEILEKVALLVTLAAALSSDVSPWDRPGDGQAQHDTPLRPLSPAAQPPAPRTCLRAAVASISPWEPSDASEPQGRTELRHKLVLVTTNNPKVRKR